MINLFEYKNKASLDEEHFEDLEMFLDSVWNKREKTAYYTEEENREEVQRFLQFFHRTNELKSNKYVGVIHFQNQTINLLPKIFYEDNEVNENKVFVINTHILWWLSYCRKLKFPNYLSGLNSEKADFFEVLIYLFSKYTKEILNSSVYQKYVEIENEINNVKGRINFNSYIKENLAKARHHKICCIYDSFEIDNDFNQCIKYVCKILLSATSDYKNKRSLNDILFLLDDVSDVTISADQCKRIKFNPLFSHFETVRDYCSLFLENSISFNYKNELKLFAFLLPMEYVFEDFIYGFIDREIEAVNPKGQVSGVYLDEDKTFSLKPDLILDLGFKKVIADTKYKLVYSNDLDPKCGVSQSDLYQMVSYAIRFSINEVKLFYPTNMADTLLGDFNIKIKDTLADGKEIEVSAHQLPVIDLNLIPEEIKSHQNFINSFEKLKNDLVKRLEAILFSHK
ncbi:5-methylcytosine-specific restriction enzyme subunit McrC [Epilithonimonas lactis]|nr:5-methylcytosine-specific restriction enzyme subunit McrC [Epilithonimonas lactis]